MSEDTILEQNAPEGSQEPVQSDNTILGVKIPENVPEATPGASEEVLKWFGDDLPEELKKSPTMKKFKTVEDLAKSYLNAQGLLGKKLQDMGPDELKSIYGKMANVPADAEGYKVDVEMDPDTLKLFKQTAHEMMLSPEQAKLFIEKFAGINNEAALAQKIQMEQAMQNAENTLRKDWGKGMEYNLKLAEKAIKEFGGEQLAKDVEALGLGNNVNLIKAFAKVGENLLESGLIGDTGATQFSMTPDQAQTAISQKLMSVEFQEAYYNPMHPAHNRAVEELSQLYDLKG